METSSVAKVAIRRRGFSGYFITTSGSYDFIDYFTTGFTTGGKCKFVPGRGLVVLIIIIVIFAIIDVVSLIIYTARWGRVLKDRLIKGMLLIRLEVIIQGRHVFELIGRY